MVTIVKAQSFSYVMSPMTVLWADLLATYYGVQPTIKLIYILAIRKELPRVDRARNPVGDDKIKTLVTWWY